jgi:thiosulfate/3-mercaptopyruvate sulfurtransferase
MSENLLPLLTEPEELGSLLGDMGLLILDLRAPDKYVTGHVPGAINACYGTFLLGQKPAMGLLPPLDRLSRTLSALGLDADTHVVTYDDEGGGRAARVIWTLHTLGHPRCSLLDGGIHSWANEGHAMETGQLTPTPSRYEARLDGPEVLATRDYVRSKLDSEQVLFLDTRTAGEYTGTDVRAARGGHIPGAVNLDWTASIDRDRDLRLLPVSKLTEQLSNLGVTPDKEIVVYCQTHHRSSHSYVMLKHAGFPRVRGYAGAWSEWGNDPSLPVET